MVSNNPFDYYSKSTKRCDIKVPLLVILDDDEDSSSNQKKLKEVIFPMPSSHLPQEISTLNLYGAEMTSPSHIRMIEEAAQSENKSYGHVVWIPNHDNDGELVGAIGCTMEIIASGSSKDGGMTNDDNDASSDDNKNDGDVSVTVLVRGSFRFIVKEIVSTFPYPIAIVDELLDEEHVNVVDEVIAEEEKKEEIIYDDDSDLFAALSGNNFQNDDDDGIVDATAEHQQEDDDEDDEEEDVYQNMESPELTSRCIEAMKILVRMRLEQTDTSSTNSNSNPLRDEILSAFGPNSQLAISSSMERSSAEEAAAVLEVFLSEMVEMNDVIQRRYAIGIMACEIVRANGDMVQGADNMGFGERVQALITTNGVDRLRGVVRFMERKISLERAKSMAAQLTEGGSQDERDLKLGTPPLPPWAFQMKAGDRLEYFWSEEDGWCKGIVRDVVKVIDEIIVTVEFDDGETHKVPLVGDQKARWRPIQEDDGDDDE
eukprot:CAMPEP_0195539914 /NCGR_PEP_ID=MMETSP0794_2-20130614/50306_1 /TAXON_ID=515487 /ORGANISM="Stephanopyxis turris, Strain CCMP 815" /LENGTH=485 /DNA_ID=CAMNT_0040673973 /DNA_START=138 /DNA_END=1593 /DNA_ORIENTATION=-